MTDDLVNRARKNCCRLCLAPDNECVPIFTSLAADKEPISLKILACVSIKIFQADTLSSKICHACISYLNSWQSFKNRCFAAQLKQRNWLDQAKNTFRKQFDQMHQVQNSNVTIHQDKMPLPFIIKQEPLDETDIKEEDDDDYEDDSNGFYNDNEGDYGDNETTSQFLARPQNAQNEGPQILTSLGLTHINSVNPFSFLSTELGNETATTSNENPSKKPKLSQERLSYLSTVCSVCKVTFSSHANRKRHERNIHGKGLDPNASSVGYKLPKPKPILTPEMRGIYDYTKPEKYRYMLTDQKIFFIRKNENFLKQFQDFKCNCCSKTHDSYKQFMAHMRKRNPSIAKNVCFKCLKHFQSRAFFVSHLKKRNCIDLYKLYLLDDAISKTAPLSITPDKMGAKELLTNKVYECKLCSQTFRLKMEFRSHVYEQHVDNLKREIVPGTCCFCQIKIEDPTTRKNHSNLECIVVLHCGTCKEKFDNHQKFIEHVYGVHLPQPTINNNEENNKLIKRERSGQSKINENCPLTCNICGLSYNNYYNVLRHMEAKHPGQLPNTYTCPHCDAGFPRQSSLRDHMYKEHGRTVPRAKRDQIQCKQCTTIFDTIEKWLQHQTDKHSNYSCCHCNYQSLQLSEFEKHITIHTFYSKSNISEATKRSFSNGIEDCTGTDDDKSLLVPMPPKKIKLEQPVKECQICHAVFNSSQGLSNHMRAHIAQQQIKRSLEKQSNTSTPNGEIRMFETQDKDVLRRLRCRICQKRFTTKKGYKRHMLIEHQIKDVSFIKCTQCNAEFTHSKGLKVHMFRIHGTVATDDDVSDIQYECHVCSTVYRDEEQLNAHKSSVHGIPINDPSTSQDSNDPTYWYQCRYCTANFDSNKKLAIHLNSHPEIDSTDTSCQDCGNVYSGRKSLWVHRYKKHPLIANPGKCELCDKVFFDKKMLVLHLRNHTSDDVYEQIKKLEEFITPTNVNGENETHTIMPDIQIDDDENPDDIEIIDEYQPNYVPCTFCSEKFTDQEEFTNHMKIHELELYNDNPLAAMLDIVPDNPSQFYINRLDENGEYICDICPKSFTTIAALKVHRNWHFRNESKQSPMDQKNFKVGNSSNKKNRSSNSNIICKYCSSKFANPGNLKRHMSEQHRTEMGTRIESPNIFIEKYLECQKCSKKFETNAEWVEHKINHIKSTKPDLTVDWCCEICGKIISRKDRLIQHMAVHFKNDDILYRGPVTGDQCNSETGFETNSQDSITSSNTGHQSTEIFASVSNNLNKTSELQGKEEILITEPAIVINEDLTESEDDRVENLDDDDIEIIEEKKDLKKHVDLTNDTEFDLEENFDDEEETNDNEIQFDEYSSNSENNENNLGEYSCDLCQVYFDTSKQLRRHVATHFLNGPGSVTLTQYPKDKSTTLANVQSDY